MSGEKPGPVGDEDDLDFTLPADPGFKPEQGPVLPPMAWPPPKPAKVPKAPRGSWWKELREDVRSDLGYEGGRAPRWWDMPFYLLMLVGSGLGWLWDIVTWPVRAPYTAIRVLIAKARGTYTGTDWRRPWK